MNEAHGPETDPARPTAEFGERLKKFWKELAPEEKRAIGRNPAARLLAEGDAVGDWTVGGFVGRGGSAEVYCARHRTLQKTAVLKVLHRAEPAQKERFRREARFLMGVPGPSFPAIFGVGELPDGRPWMALEMLEEYPLPSADADVARYLLEVAAGVAVLHARGYVHRDLKPANILRREIGGHAVLIDFGLIKSIDGPTVPVADGLSVADDGRAVGAGTPGYAAPELFAGGEATPAVDVYALGMIADRCFGGHPPRAWTRIVAKATQSLPRLRYPGMEAFMRAVRHRHRPARLAVAALVAAGLLAVGNGLFARGKAPPPADVQTVPAAAPAKETPVPARMPPADEQTVPEAAPPETIAAPAPPPAPPPTVQDPSAAIRERHAKSGALMLELAQQWLDSVQEESPKDPAAPEPGPPESAPEPPPAAPDPAEPESEPQAAPAAPFPSFDGLHQAMRDAMQNRQKAYDCMREAQKWMDMGVWDKGLQAAEEGLALIGAETDDLPDKVDCQFLLATAWYLLAVPDAALRNPERAARLAKKARDAGTTGATMDSIDAALQFEAGDTAGAVETMARIVASGKGDSDARRQLDCYSAGKRCYLLASVPSEDLLQRMAEADRLLQTAHDRLAGADWSGGLAAAEEAMSLVGSEDRETPRPEDAKYLLATSWILLVVPDAAVRDADRAGRLFRRALEVHVFGGMTGHIRAALRFAEGDLVEAARTMRAVVEAEGDLVYEEPETERQLRCYEKGEPYYLPDLGGSPWDNSFDPYKTARTLSFATPPVAP